MARGKGDDGPHLVDRHVGRRVETRRKSLGYSQSQLGAALGLTFQQIQKYEKGANRISASKLWEISQFFKVEIGYFFDGLTAAEPGVAESDTVSFDHDFPVTRQSQEIARLAPRLSLSQQKAALAMVRELAGERKGDERD
ncbi:helix-turn-helix transcriptional regulator [Brevundimonas sp.]|uniref:helix-turn-helix domain-containing protein n=1 Tax=Brevundimonas sp. TaxID=1871086 RepID=UPI001DE6EAEF|nr:helix-turn-helix transcriptional regulator [Brevundimonas sp.]MBA3999526.1 XRE family transcriptional regulator [Brevundimonas sp.]